LEPFLNTIERIINKIGKKKNAIAIDANANSEVWFSSQTDKRGRLIEEFPLLLANRLYTANKPFHVFLDKRRVKHRFDTYK